MVAKLLEGFDVVYGTPEKEAHGFVRDMASQVTKLALQAGYGRRNGPQSQCLPRVPDPYT